MERLVDDVRKVLRIRDQPVMLGAGARDADGIGLLKGVVADHEGGHLARQHDKRDAVHQRVGQARHRVGGTRAGGHEHDAGPAGRARIALGGMDRGLFVAHEDVADVVLLENLVIDREHGTAGIAEHDIHALVPEGLNHHFRAAHLTCHRSCSVCDVIPIRMKKPPVGWRGRMGCRNGLPLPAHAPFAYDKDNPRHGPPTPLLRGGDIRRGGKGRQAGFADKMSRGA